MIIWYTLKIFFFSLKTLVAPRPPAVEGILLVLQTRTPKKPILPLLSVSFLSLSRSCSQRIFSLSSDSGGQQTVRPLVFGCTVFVYRVTQPTKSVAFVEFLLGLSLVERWHRPASIPEGAGWICFSVVFKAMRVGRCGVSLVCVALSGLVWLCSAIADEINLPIDSLLATGSKSPPPPPLLITGM